MIGESTGRGRGSERADERFDVRGPLFGVLRERPADHFVERGARGHDRRERRCLVIEDGSHRREFSARIVEEASSSEELPCDHRGREDIGARVESFLLDVLRRHVGKRSARVANDSGGRSRPEAGDAEVGDPSDAIDPDEDVPGRHIAVNEPVGVDRAETGAQVEDDPGRDPGWQRRELDELRERGALDVVEDEGELLRCLHDRVGRDDVRMVEAERERRFPAQPRASGLVVEEPRVGTFYRDQVGERAFSGGGPGKVHRRHSSRADPSEELHAFTHLSRRARRCDEYRMRRAFVLAVSFGAAFVAGAGCESEGDDLAALGGPIAWISPAANASIPVNETVELSVKVTDPKATAVRFVIDGALASTCDPANTTDCKKGDLWRFSTSFQAEGLHYLTAAFDVDGGETRAEIAITVVARTAPTSDAGVDTTPGTGRGFLDPDRPSHNVFGGISWSVEGQKVVVIDPPASDIEAVAACMERYGASIVKHADAFEVSRGSVVATAITESNCTNPAGSSDGLSSGPMQVTGSTCASVAGGGISGGACKKKMHDDVDYSFLIGAKYMGSSYQTKQHDHDPPKIGAAYNAGSVRSSSQNRWHMVVTGNHLERFVGAYNAYRAWEAMNAADKATLSAKVASLPEPLFEGEHAPNLAEIRAPAREGQVVFVGDWDRRDGFFSTFRGGAWTSE